MLIGVIPVIPCKGGDPFFILRLIGCNRRTFKLGTQGKEGIHRPALFCLDLNLPFIICLRLVVGLNPEQPLQCIADILGGNLAGTFAVVIISTRANPPQLREEFS